VYALGGSVATCCASRAVPTAEVYRADSASWEALAAMPTARTDLAAVATPDGRVYAIGGSAASGQALTTVERYSPGTDTWTRVASLHTPRAALAAALGPDGRIYAIGGANGEHQLHLLATVEAYDPATDRWQPAPPLPRPLESLAAATVDGRVFAVGGQDAGGIRRVVTSLPPGARRWQAETPLRTARMELGLAARAGTVVAVGGCCVFRGGDDVLGLDRVESLRLTS
jgi:hypothetical protein